MLCPLIALLAFSLFSANVYADDPDPTKLATVKKTLDKVDADARRNRKAYDEANEKSFREAEKALKAEADRLSKAEKPEEAVAVKKLIDGLKDRLAGGGEGKAPVPRKPLQERVTGHWDAPEAILVVDLDGSCRQVGKDNGQVLWKSRIQPQGENTFVVVWPNAWGWQCHMAGNDVIAVLNVSPQGQRSGGSVLMRIMPPAP